MANRYNGIVKRRRGLASVDEGSDEMPDLYADTQIESDFSVPESNSASSAGGAMVSSGNPVAMGVGAGLAVMGEAAKRRDQQKMLEYQAKQDRIQRQQQAISRLIGITDSMRAL